MCIGRICHIHCGKRFLKVVGKVLIYALRNKVLGNEISAVPVNLK